MLEREWISQVPEVLEEAELLKGKEEIARITDAVRRLTKEVLAERLTLFRPRSRCPHCGKTVRALHNVPVFGYLYVRGKCAECGNRISAQYPIVELLAGVGAFYAAYLFGPSLKAVAVAGFSWAVIALAFIDQQRGYLPDDITLPLVWLGLLVNIRGAFVPINDAIIGAVAGYMVLWSINALFKAIRGIDGMGQGDFKMTAAVGAFLGWKALFMVILLSSLVGLFFGAVQMFAARGGWDWRFKFHFGPYIAMAGLVAMFWGPRLATLYPTLQPFR